MTPVLSNRSIAARGALIGIVSVVVWAAALWTTVRLIDPRPHEDIADLLLHWMGAAVGLGVPAGVIAGALVARAVRLPRPWLVPLLGSVASALLLFGGLLVVLPDLPQVATWIEDGVLVLAGYAGAALLAARGRRRLTPAAL